MSGNPRIVKTPELCALVLQHVMDGKSLRKIGQLKGMPKKSTFLQWASTDESLMDQYARAMKVRADHGFDEFLELADKTTPKNANAQRVKLDAHKWALGRMNPKKYGDFQRNELSGPDGAPLVRNLTDDQLNARLAALLLGPQPGAKNGNGHAPGGAGQAPAREQAGRVLPR